MKAVLRSISLLVRRRPVKDNIVLAIEPISNLSVLLRLKRLNHVQNAVRMLGTMVGQITAVHLHIAL